MWIPRQCALLVHQGAVEISATERGESKGDERYMLPFVEWRINSETWGGGV